RASLRPLPALKRATRRLGILTAAPVCGFRPMRALRTDVLKVPKPTNVIDCPFLSVFTMPSMADSIAAAALVFVMPVSFATFSTSSCLFIVPPIEPRERQPQDRTAQTALRLYASD